MNNICKKDLGQFYIDLKEKKIDAYKKYEVI